MKTILGLDLGTNSIGWALIETDFENKLGSIIGLGSRIIPMSQAILSEFGKGNTESQTAQRTEYRGKRRLIQRTLLRRERLHRVLNIINFLPKHYADAIDFEKRLGQFKDTAEPKIAYKQDSNDSFQFIFKESYNEMLKDFKQTQPQLFGNKGKEGNGKTKNIPYDWTLYYLRTKALTDKISKEELAWILLNFNQKRGYYQLRGEEEESNKTAKIRKEFITETVQKIEFTGETYKDNKIFLVSLTNNIKTKLFKKEIPDWIGVEKDFILSIEIDKEGNDKIENGVLLCRISVPKEDDWGLLKGKAEKAINRSHNKMVGTYIYHNLLKKPNQKITGKLVRTIERSFYKDELKAILEKQKEFHSELNSVELLDKCAEHLYAYNYPHKNNLKKEKGMFTHLFLNDIIFYQRPLKSKKSLIAECKYEFRQFIDKDTNEKKKLYLKCIAKSHPLFQEFRLWEFVHNIKIYQREKQENGRLQTDVNVTSNFLTCEKDYVMLYEFLNDRKSIKQSIFLSHFKLKPATHRWNYVEENEYPCNETRASFITVLKQNKAFDWKTLLTQVNEINLWHTLYSINDKKELRKALHKLAAKLNLTASALEPFNTVPPFKKDYGSFSTKALNKLLPLMRKGKYWVEENINPKTKDRIDKLLTGEFDEKIRDRVREKAINLNSIEEFRGLPLWLASYVVYDRNSEADDLKIWIQPNEITLLKQHSLRNPIVEQIINETLQVVKNIWEQYAETYTVIEKGEEVTKYKQIFDEIHVELGRDMKNPKKDRERMTKQISANKNTNERVRTILKELMDDDSIEGNVKEYSPGHQDIFKIFEDGILTKFSEIELKKEKLEDISSTAYDVSNKSNPSQKEIQKYRLWLDQKYQSPYTGEVIPLSKLFTNAYEIEHVLPKSRYFDNSITNKVICEAVINAYPYKGAQTGYEFIENQGGKIVNELSTSNKKVDILTKDKYEELVKRNFKGRKKDILLMAEIPESFTNRQLNDSRYIGKVVLNLMSKIVRKNDEQEQTSKKVIPVTGKITSRLKKDWGLNEVWNDLVTPRFKRLNQLVTEEGDELSAKFGFYDFQKDRNGKNLGKQFFRTQVPDELKKDFEKKRIDHRHHALDALVIALASRSHVNYLNNKNAADSKKDERIDLKKTLCFKTKPDSQGNYRWDFHKPWENITKETKTNLENTVVSFKQNKRVLTKTNNYFESYKDENGNLRLDKEGNPKKGFIKQKGMNKGVRKPLHEDTFYGIIENGENKGKLILRKPIDSSFNKKKIEAAVSSNSVKKILLNHLQQEKFQNQKNDNGNLIKAEELAFAPEGLEDMNKNIQVLNDGKYHYPIYKVKLIFEKGKKFPIRNYIKNGEKKQTKYAKSAGGTNLFFVIKEHIQTKNRKYETIPLKDVIDAMKEGEQFVVEEVGYSWFTLSPNDLVYVPTEEEKENPNLVDFNNLNSQQINQIYLFTDGSGTTANFIPNSSANTIFNISKKDQVKKGLNYPIQNEYGIGSPQSKNQRSIEGVMIKESCWKLKVDRLGNIVEVTK